MYFGLTDLVLITNVLKIELDRLMGPTNRRPASFLV